MMRYIFEAFLCCALLCYTAELGAQCMPANNYVCNGNPNFVSRGNKPATDQWKSVTVTQTGFHYLTVYDSALGLSNTNELLYELKTCGTGKIQLHCQQYGGYNSANAVKQNADNYTCGGGAYNEHMFFTGQNCVVHILGDSCLGTTDTFTLYYRVFCRPLANKNSYGNQVWRSNIYNSGLWTLEKYTGSYGEESKDFTRTFTNGQPDSVSGYCAMCPGGNTLDTTYYTAEYRMNWAWQGKGYYKIVCNTPLRLRLWHNGSGMPGVLDYASGTQPAQKFAITKLDSFNTNAGKWEYRVYKDTVPFKADISLCKMEGDGNAGNGFWKTYVHDHIQGAPTEGRIVADNGWNNYYQGTFNTSGPVFGYNWNGVQPPMTGERCGQTMGNDTFRLDMKMKLNLTAGNYKFRVRCSGPPQLIVSPYTVILTWPFATANDQITAYYYLNGNTDFNLNTWHRAGPHYVSFNYARQPKNVGSISSGSGDTVCAGSSVTLTADTVDGTQRVWYIKCTGTGSSISCANGILVGTGNSITVTPDSSTTYYVRNRNRVVAQDDTLNVLDLYSAAWASRRITRVAVPQAPTAPSSQTVCSDTAYAFVWDSVYAGSGGNQIEWASNSAFTGSTIIGSGGSINKTVNVGATDTIWIRSRNSATGCVSGSVWMTGRVNGGLAIPSVMVAQNTDSTVFYLKIGENICYDQVEWSIDSIFSNSQTAFTPVVLQRKYHSDTSEVVWFRRKDSGSGKIGMSRSVLLETTDANQIEPTEGELDECPQLQLIEVFDDNDIQLNSHWAHACLGETLKIKFNGSPLPIGTTATFRWEYVNTSNLGAGPVNLLEAFAEFTNQDFITNGNVDWILQPSVIGSHQVRMVQLVQTTNGLVTTIFTYRIGIFNGKPAEFKLLQTENLAGENCPNFVFTSDFRGVGFLPCNDPPWAGQLQKLNVFVTDGVTAFNDDIFLSDDNSYQGWVVDFGSIDIPVANFNGFTTITFTETSPCFANGEHLTEFIVWVGNCCTGEKIGSTDNTYTLYKHPNPTLASDINPTWFLNNSNKVAINGTLIIDNHFTISNCPNVAMGKDAQIILQPGASLVIENSHLHSCGEFMWEGITVQGNPNQSQQAISGSGSSGTYHQGAVFLNNATIEHAEVAVNLSSAATAFRGGIVQATSSTFANNRYDVVMPPYRWQNANNNSRFLDCHFTTTDALLSSDPNPRTHALLFGVRGVRFWGCKFENTRNGLTYDYELGNGIMATDASFRVDDFCAAYSGSTCTDLRESRFVNLRHGISTGRLLNPQACSVKHTDFDHCLRAIRNEGVNFANFSGNNIAVGNTATITDITDFNKALLDEGIILRQCTGFTVEGNAISPAIDGGTPAVELTIGIRADGTGGNYNAIRNNSFNELAYANLANRQNRNIFKAPFAGLEYLCNQQADNGFDICVTAPIWNDPNNGATGVQQNQGNLNKATGNTFTDIPEQDGSFFNQSTNSNNYFWYLTGTDEQPIDVSPDVTPISTNSPGGCPSTTNNGTNNFNHFLAAATIGALSSQYSSNNALLQTEKAALTALTDGGNTTSMLAYLNTYSSAADSTAVLDTLLALSPWLSVELLESASQKETSIPNYSMMQVLLANPDAIQTQALVEHLQRRNPAMPQAWIDSALAHKGTLTARTYLEDSIVRHTAACHAAAYEMLSRIALNEDSIDHTALRNWLDSLQSPNASMYKALTYMETDAPDTALVKLRAIKNNFTLSREDSLQLSSVDTLLSFYVSWYNTQSDTNLRAGDFSNIDSTTLAALDSFASQQNEFLNGTQMARNFMNVYGRNYFTEAQLPDAEPEARRAQPENQLREEKENLLEVKVYPNPAKDYFIFEITGGNGDVTVEIYDAYGRAVEIKKVAGVSQLIFETKNWNSGIYLWRVNALGEKAENGKISVLRW